MNKIKRMIAVAVLMLSAVAAFAQNQGYRILGDKVYYNNTIMHEADPRTIHDLGYGYAKDAFDAYYCGKEVVGSSASTFQVLGNGYAKDAWETYYLGKKVR